MPALPAGVSAPNPGDSHRLHTAPSRRLGPGGQPGAGTTSLPGEGTVGRDCFWARRGEAPGTQPRGRGGRAAGSPPVPQASSSLPSMQSASASQRQRRGMQWPLLHWNWSMSQRGVQSFCGPGRGTRSDLGTPAAPDSPPVPRPPRPSRRHSRGPRRISSAQRCSGHWHRRTHFRSRAEGLEGRDRPRKVGIGARPWAE